jgi:hypothetical protein
MNRRRFLATTALAGLLPAAARGFSIVDADAEAKRLYLAACHLNEADRHRRLVEELRAQLTAIDEDEIIAALAAARCPACGCPLVE